MEYKLPRGSCPTFAIPVGSRVYTRVDRACAHSVYVCLYIEGNWGLKKENKPTIKGKNKCANVKREQEGGKERKREKKERIKEKEMITQQSNFLWTRRVPKRTRLFDKTAENGLEKIRLEKKHCCRTAVERCGKYET